MAAHHEVEVTIGDHPRRLCYTMAAYRRLRTQGIDLLSSTADGKELSDVGLLCPIVWAGLVDADRTALPTVESVEALVMPTDLTTLLTAVTKAITLAANPEVRSDGIPLG